MGRDEVPGQASRLAAEEEHVLVRVVEIRVDVAALGGGQKEPVGLGAVGAVEGHEVRETLVDAHLDVGPVVQTRALQSFVIDGEAQGLHQVKDGVGGGAGASDVARVGRDLGFDENYM